MEDIETLQAFRSAGADLNEMDYDKRTALHVVSSTDNVISNDRYICVCTCKT